MYVQGTCQEVGQVGVQVLQHVDGRVQEEHGVIIAIQQPLVGVSVVPARIRMSLIEHCMAAALTT